MVCLPVKTLMFPLFQNQLSSRCVEDLDKKFALWEITETVKQLIIINVLFFIEL
jgi:hypothetical protein